MTYLTVLDQATVHILHARTQFFLWDQRHRRGNEGWFTVADIANDFEECPPLIPLIVALRDFAETGNLECDGTGRVRHVRH